MIPNPMNPGNPIWDMAFNFYAMEESGLTMTKKGCLNNLCDLILENRSSLDIDPDYIYQLETEANIDWVFDPDDLDYIYRRTGIYLTVY